MKAKKGPFKMAGWPGYQSPMKDVDPVTPTSSSSVANTSGYVNYDANEPEYEIENDEIVFTGKDVHPQTGESTIEKAPSEVEEDVVASDDKPKEKWYQNKFVQELGMSFVKSAIANMMTKKKKGPYNTNVGSMMPTFTNPQSPLTKKKKKK